MTAFGNLKRSGRALFIGKEAVQKQKELKEDYKDQGYSKKEARQNAIHDVKVDKARDKEKKDKAKLQKRQQKKEAALQNEIDKQLKNATNMTMSKKAKAALGTVRKKLSSKRNLQPQWPGFAESD